MTRPRANACPECNGTGDRKVWMGEGYDAADCWLCHGSGVVPPAIPGCVYPAREACVDACECRHGCAGSAA